MITNVTKEILVRNSSAGREVHIVKGVAYTNDNTPVVKKSVITKDGSTPDAITSKLVDVHKNGYVLGGSAPAEYIAFIKDSNKVFKGISKLVTADYFSSSYDSATDIMTDISVEASGVPSKADLILGFSNLYPTSVLEVTHLGGINYQLKLGVNASRRGLAGTVIGVRNIDNPSNLATFMVDEVENDIVRVSAILNSSKDDSINTWLITGNAAKLRCNIKGKTSPSESAIIVCSTASATEAMEFSIKFGV